LTLYQLLH